MALAHWDGPEAVEADWDDFVRHLRRKKRSEKTIELYRNSFITLWRWLVTAHSLSAMEGVTTDLVNLWTDYQQTVVGDTTVAIRYRNGRPFFTWWAGDTGNPNPFTGADQPPEAEHLPAVVDLDDVRLLTKACSGKELADLRDEAIVRVFFDTGIRLGEMEALTVTSWNRKHDHLHVVGKTGERTVTLSASTGDVLARYVRLRMRLGVESDAMWIGRRGTPLMASGIGQALERRCEQAGIDPVNPHRFRHTWAHMMKKKGISDGDLMYLGGWSSMEMPRHYGKSAEAERARETGRRIGLGDLL